MTPRNMRYRKDEMRYRKRQKWDGVSLVYVLVSIINTQNDKILRGFASYWRCCGSSIEKKPITAYFHQKTLWNMGMRYILQYVTWHVKMDSGVQAVGNSRLSAGMTAAEIPHVRLANRCRDGGVLADDTGDDSFYIAWRNRFRLE